MYIHHLNWSLEVFDTQVLALVTNVKDGIMYGKITIKLKQTITTNYHKFYVSTFQALCISVNTVSYDCRVYRAESMSIETHPRSIVTD